jgi:16S rRNA processing protein RimM
MKEYLECASVIRIHGLNGGLIVNHMCDSYEAFAKIKTLYLRANGAYSPLKVKKISPCKSGALVLFSEICDADSATKLRSKTLYAHRNDVPLEKGSFFIVDLLGLDVFDADSGERYGKLKDVTNSGAQDIYVIESDSGSLSYVPAIKEFVKEISLDKGILITPIEGMIE